MPQRLIDGMDSMKKFGNFSNFFVGPLLLADRGFKPQIYIEGGIIGWRDTAFPAMKQ